MTDASKLHRYHCFPKASRLHVDLPDGQQTWRMDGRAPLDLKAAIAHRLAVCWNVLEGMPTELLEQGLLLDLVQAVEAGDMDRAKAALVKMDAGSDDTDGRPHDCKGCLARGAGQETL